MSADNWYASIDNLEFLRNREVGFLAGLETNRIVSSEPGCYEQVRKTKREDFDRVKAQHWQVEGFFRTVKQACRAQGFFVLGTRAIKSHIFCVLRAFQRLLWITKEHVLPCNESYFCKSKENPLGTLRAPMTI